MTIEPLHNRNIGIRRVRVADILENPSNWRLHPDNQVNAFTGAVDEVGWYGYPDCFEHPDFPGQVMLIDGALRREWLYARYGEDAEIDVNVTDHTPEESKKAILTKDPLAALAETDAASLEALMRDVQIADEALAAMVEGMAEDAGIIPPDVPPDIVEDVPPEPPVVPVTRPGDLWTLCGENGIEHRLLCADCRDPAAWERLLGGERAACVFTDPPYGVSVAAKNRLLNSVQPSGRCLTDIVDDDLTPDELKASLLPAFTLLRERGMADDCTLFVTAPQGGDLGMMMMMMMEEAS